MCKYDQDALFKSNRYTLFKSSINLPARIKRHLLTQRAFKETGIEFMDLYRYRTVLV